MKKRNDEEKKKLFQNSLITAISLLSSGIITCITGADGRYEKACLFMLAFICIKELLKE